MTRWPLLLLCLLLAACAPREQAAPGQLPRFEAGDYRGSWVVINYWAAWCKPCIKEIPELNALDREEGVAVLGVNFDGTQGAELASQMDSLGIGFPVLLEEPLAAVGAPRPNVLPTTFLLNPEGKLAKTLVGPQTRESLLRALGRDPAASEAAAPAGGSDSQKNGP